MSQEQTSKAALENLRDTGLTLADADEDIRGRKVVDVEGRAIGHVSALFVDEDERKIRMLEIRGGGFLGLGDRHFLLPVEAIAEVTGDAVRVSETQERVIHSPAYEPMLLVAGTADYWEPFYGYYGVSPYGGAGFAALATSPEAQEDRELARRDAGENYGGFGKMIDDAPAAELDRE